MSQFQRRYSDAELLAMVREVAEAGDPASPGSITQRAYNAAREGAGYPDAPEAQRIAKRLKSTWAQVLDLAFEDSNPSQTIGVRKGKKSQTTLTPAVMGFSLQRVANHLNTDRLTAGQYEEGRNEMVEADKSRYKRGGNLAWYLPKSGAIIAAAGSWEQALVYADLGAVQASDGLPTYPAASALDDFIDDYGFAPHKQELIDYQKKRGMAAGRDLAHNSEYDDFGKWLRGQLKSGLAKRHKVKQRGRGEKPPAGWETMPISPAPPGYLLYRKPEKLTLAECEAAIGTALDAVAPKTLTQQTYQRLAVTKDLPSLSSIQRVLKQEQTGLTWGQLRDKVIAERARKPRRQTRKPARNQTKRKKKS